MNSITTDLKENIIIVGAGPAGATLSLFLSKYKIPHTIIDKATFPRDKTCGDGFTSEVARVLKEIDPKLYQEYIDADWTERCDGIYAETHSWAKVNFEFPHTRDDSSVIYCAKRAHFDNWLVSKLASPYSKVLLGIAVKEVTKINDGFKLNIQNNSETATLNCRLLIGADGERSIVRKTLHPKGIAKDRQHYAAAIRQYWKGITPLSDKNPLEIYFIAKPFFGYLWIFQLPNGESNVGIGGLSAHISKENIKLSEELRHFIAKHPRLKDRFKNAEALESPKGWGLPLNSDAYENVGDHYLLLGDAGKHIEPLTGKGIGVSMYVAALTAKVIDLAHQKEDYSLNILKKYEGIVEKRLRKEWDNYHYYQTHIDSWWIPYLVGLFNIGPLRRWYGKYYSKDWDRKIHQDFEAYYKRTMQELEEL